MSPSLPLPDWMPWWGQLAVMVGVILFGIAFLMMPFAVFGVKGRLDLVEARLDDIQVDLRMLTTRLSDPPPAPQPVVDDLPPRSRPIRSRPHPPPVPPVLPETLDQPPLSRRPQDDPGSRRPQDERPAWPQTPSLEGEPELPRRTLRAPLPEGRDQQRDDQRSSRSEPRLRWPPR